MSNANATPRDSSTAKAPQLRGWVEIFRAGTHTDAKGREFTASVDDLDEIVANHQLGRAPAVLGHPKDNDPAYAWVEALQRDGESLFAKFGDINPAFDDGVAIGAYRNRSIKLVRDRSHGLRLWHVGWLGAQPPAIDGLSPNPVQFAASDLDDDYEFAQLDDAAASLAWAIDGIGRLLRGFRDHVIEQDGTEVADRVLPTWSIENVIQQAQSAREALARDVARVNSFSHPANAGDPQMPNITLTQAELDARLAAARQEAQQTAEAQFAAQGQELAELRAQRLSDKVDGLINDWKAKGLVVPADEPALREFMASLSEQQVFEFSAAEGQAAVQKQPLDWFAEFMAGRKQLVKLGGSVIDGNADDAPLLNLADPKAIQDAAVEFQRAEAQAGRTVSFELAVQHVSTQPKKA
jgi:hypothetical protein